MQFIQARNYTLHPSQRAIHILVVHDMESDDKPDTAENVAKWFAGTTAPQASAHYCVDQNSIVQCVRDRDIAWHAPGANSDGIGVEFAGWARYTREQWQTEANAAMLEIASGLFAAKCAQYSVPPVFLRAPQLIAGRRGITTHWEVTKAYRLGDHWDPGENFPMDIFCTKVYSKVSKLLKSILKPVDNPALKTIPPPVNFGDKGYLVKKVQKLLTAYGLPTATDGIFGKNTRENVKHFQQLAGLVPDGSVGFNTWRALLAHTTVIERPKGAQ